MEILIGTNNKHKISEIKNILKDMNIILKSSDDMDIKVDVEENAMTLEGNAFKKAKAFYDRVKIPVFADDTGLFVDLICGHPGVFSSRYAGEDATYEENCQKLLKDLKDIPLENRTASFKTVICFYENPDTINYFKGVVTGKIIDSPRGKNGFGYDPLFVPDGYDKTYAEMGDDEKNRISHRARALEKFKEYLSNKIKKQGDK